MGVMSYRKKLIEVALPLDAINAESAREKSICHEHPGRWVCLNREQIPFDMNGDPCYKSITSPLFLRGQGARRLTTASAFLML